jgi:hypothetical protein
VRACSWKTGYTRETRGLLYWSRRKSASEIDLVISDIAVLGLIACWCRHNGVGTGYIPCVDITVSAMDTSRVSASRYRDWILSVCRHHGVRERILFARRTRSRIRLLNCALMAVGAIALPLVCWLRVPSHGWVRVLLSARAVS